MTASHPTETHDRL